MKQATQGATWGGRRARAVGALMSVGLAFGGSIATAGTASAEDSTTSITVAVDAPTATTSIKTKAGGVVTTLRFGSTWS